MCFFDFFFFKTYAWIPGKCDVPSDCLKIQQLQLSLGEKSTFFTAPEVAWCLSIVGQTAKATYIRVRNNF